MALSNFQSSLLKSIDAVIAYNMLTVLIEFNEQPAEVRSAEQEASRVKATLGIGFTRASAAAFFCIIGNSHAAA